MRNLLLFLLFLIVVPVRGWCQKFEMIPVNEPGEYTFYAQVRKAREEWKEPATIPKIIIQPPFWKTWWFWLSIVGGVSIIIYVSTHLRARAVRKQERLRLGHEKELLELEARALRAQMNPHFIFNCLNSIKSLIQDDQKDKSVTYLTTFSKLIRTLFNNADKKEISLFDEIETCKLYLQLEAMRFDSKFSYEIRIDETIDLKSISVPALIIQPFIENAIWHGIVPKAAGGNIVFMVDKKDNNIEITVEDDGIGRQASQNNKATTRVGHQSRGVSLTQSRLELDNVLQQRDARLMIVDKYDGSGKAAGTKITLVIRETE